jgi:two-component sensor histidine kinase
MSEAAHGRAPERRLTAKLQSVSLLYDLSSRLIASATMEQALDEILDAANLLHGAEQGRVQLYDSLRNEFEMVASRGFQPGLFDAIRPVKPGDRFASAQALASGKPVLIGDIERDDEYAPYRDLARAGGYRAMLATPLISSGGEFVGVLSTYFPEPHKPSRREMRVNEIYARQAANVVTRFRAERALRRTEETLRLANRELYHRSKNMLAIIQSIAAQTLRATRDPEKFVDAFMGRLLAIDRAQSLLTGAGHQGVAIGDLIHEQAIIDPEAERRFVLSGLDVVLDPQLALNLGLVFHELATNARKYGALSNQTGEVAVTWRIETKPENRLLKLEWRESGGPEVEAPAGAGFGTVLIERVARSAEDAEAGIRYEPQGIVCTMSVPLPRPFENRPTP